MIYIYRGLLLWYGSTLHDIEYSNAVTLTRTIYQMLNSQKTTCITIGVFCEYLTKIKCVKMAPGATLLFCFPWEMYFPSQHDIAGPTCTNIGLLLPISAHCWPTPDLRLVMACLQDWKSCWRFVWTRARLEGFWSKWHQIFYEYMKGWALLYFEQPGEAYELKNCAFIGWDSHSYPLWHENL